MTETRKAIKPIKTKARHRGKLPDTKGAPPVDAVPVAQDPAVIKLIEYAKEK
jgi:hypothetical protein